MKVSLASSDGDLLIGLGTFRYQLFARVVRAGRGDYEAACDLHVAVSFHFHRINDEFSLKPQTAQFAQIRI